MASLPRDMPVVRVLSWETPRAAQTVVGRRSAAAADVDEFCGIPYGIATTRWTPAQLRPRLPRDVWDAASHNGPKCAQPAAPNHSRFYQAYLRFPADATDELDCLNLRVTRPAPDALVRRGLPSEQLPVLVWIHGGGLAFGAATDPMWDPTRLVRRSIDNGTPIVAVTVNYRLNVFGFGASADLAPDGLNLGLRDQHLALVWVARHIDAFGGDPTRVTVGGQSAGAVSVHAHLEDALAATASPPLFRRVLLHSGALGTLGPVHVDRVESAWRRLYDGVFGAGAAENVSPDERVDGLRLVPADRLLDVVAATHDPFFSVVIDGQTIVADGDGASWPMDGACRLAVRLGPVDLCHPDVSPRAPAQRIDVLMGLTDLEGYAFLPAGIVTWDHVTALLDAAGPSADVRSRLLAAYGLAPDADCATLRHGLQVLVTDLMFGVPMHEAQRRLCGLSEGDRRSVCDKASTADAGGTAVGHVQPFLVQTGNPFPGPVAGVAHHCVELIYLFGAFEDALAAADAGRAPGYVEPGAEVVTEAATEADTEAAAEAATETVTAIDGAVKNTVSEPQAQDDVRAHLGGRADGRPSNLALSHALQDVWLDFVVCDDWHPSRLPVAPGQRPAADPVLVAGTDRTLSVVETANPVWAGRTARWQELAANPDVAARLQNALWDVRFG